MIITVIYWQSFAIDMHDYLLPAASPCRSVRPKQPSKACLPKLYCIPCASPYPSWLVIKLAKQLHDALDERTMDWPTDGKGSDWQMKVKILIKVAPIPASLGNSLVELALHYFQPEINKQPLTAGSNNSRQPHWGRYMCPTRQIYYSWQNANLETDVGLTIQQMYVPSPEVSWSFRCILPYLSRWGSAVMY